MLQEKTTRQEAQLQLMERALDEQLHYSTSLKAQIAMFSETMQSVQKDSLERSNTREAELTAKVSQLSDELEQVVKQATKIGQRYQSLKLETKEKEEKHESELKQAAVVVAKTKTQLKEEREKITKLEERHVREKDTLTL